MTIHELVLKNRSYRRFYQDKPVSMETLRGFVELARLSPSATNRQGLKYILSNEPQKNARIFETLTFAGYIKGWGGPAEGERPSAYIVAVLDTSLGTFFPEDSGIAMQSILLGAAEQGLGGCMIQVINRERLAEALNIREPLQIRHVLALGVPKEQVVLEKMGPDGDVRYWRDENQVHHVPKRSLEDLILPL